MVISPEGTTIYFAIDALRREALLEGLDDISLTLKWLSGIDAWQRADHKVRPWVWNTRGEAQP